MEPRIQYAKTADSVSIAFWTLGEGTPFVDMPISPMSHTQLEWQVPEMRKSYERHAQNKMLVRYDPRGAGLSDRDVTDFSLEAHLLDLEAVVNRLGLERFALHGGFAYGPVAIAYAAQHPERVSHLILWCSWARAADAYRSPQARTILALRDKDWEIYTEAVAHILQGWSAGEEARRWAALIRESVTQEALLASLGPATGFDVTALLPQVKVPALVLHRRQLVFPALSLARSLASQIPDARLVVLEGASLADSLGDVEVVADTIDAFLGVGAQREADAPPSLGAFRTILFTDVEESTALTQGLGDAGGREVLRTHERIVREALRAYGGSEVKTMGDGFMASFTSATRALECAVALQRAFEAYNQSVQRPIRVRIGLNAGEPIAEREDLFGTAVILAARIAAQAEGGEILASNVVRELVAGKGFLFADRGEVALRGFEDPVRLYEVHWQEEA